VQTYMDTLSKMPAWKQSLPADGDAAVEAGWKKKIATGGH